MKVICSIKLGIYALLASILQSAKVRIASSNTPKDPRESVWIGFSMRGHFTIYTYKERSCGVCLHRSKGRWESRARSTRKVFSRNVPFSDGSTRRPRASDKMLQQIKLVNTHFLPTIPL